LPTPQTEINLRRETASRSTPHRSDDPHPPSVSDTPILDVPIEGTARSACYRSIIVDLGWVGMQLVASWYGYEDDVSVVGLQRVASARSVGGWRLGGDGPIVKVQVREYLFDREVGVGHR